MIECLNNTIRTTNSPMKLQMDLTDEIAARVCEHIQIELLVMTATVMKHGRERGQVRTSFQEHSQTLQITHTECAM